MNVEAIMKAAQIAAGVLQEEITPTFQEIDEQYGKLGLGILVTNLVGALLNVYEDLGYDVSEILNIWVSGEESLRTEEVVH